MTRTLTADRSERAERPRLVHWLHVVFRGGRPVDERHRIPSGATVVGREPTGARTVLAFPEDKKQSRSHATLRLRDDKVQLIDQDSHNGSIVDGHRTDRATLRDGAVLRLGDTLLVYRHGPDLPDAPMPELQGSSAEIRELRQALSLVGPTDASVVLLGESGSGKGASAEALHRLSGRPGPLVAVNCAAIQDSLAESTLFGHRAGAFTGAVRDEPGLFRAAHGGTLFIDEIGDLPASLQPKLLRALESGEVLPVGRSTPVRFDARVVAATSIDLERAVAEGTFRGELWARLAQFVTHLPSLADRREDVLGLFASFLPDGAPPLHPTLAEALLLWTWPWNVRELSNAATETMVRGRDAERLTLDMLPRLRAWRESEPAPEREPLTADRIVSLLQEHRGVVTAVARAAGISRRHLYRLLDQHELDPASFRG